MGASQSGGGAGRSVTVNNDQPIGVVHVSDEVVQRLKGQYAQGMFGFALNLKKKNTSLSLALFHTYINLDG